MLLASIVLSISCPASAQDRKSLDQYISALSESFRNDPDRFKELFGTPSSADPLLAPDIPRTVGSSRIVRIDENKGTAIVLLSGGADVGDYGGRTSASLLYSGLYRLRHSSTGWHVESRIPFEVNRIKEHRLDIELDPAVGFHATDDMDVEVTGDQGFFSGLNTAAVVRSATIDGRPATYQSRNGVFWVDARPGAHRLRINYSLAVEREPGGNSAMFGEHFGHIRNQYWWHPFFGFGIDAGLANFRITIRSPERLKVATDFPQNESVRNGVRIVSAHSETPTVASSWAYDDAWVARSYPLGKVTLELFATPDYSPAPDILVHAGDETWSILSNRFGAPNLRRIAVIQARGRDGNGWHFMSNQGIFTGARGGAPSRDDAFPVRAFFDHEVAHLWTRPSGTTRNFLAEGWATYAESLVISKRYGVEAARWFWRDQARLFLTSDAARGAVLSNDPRNSGVAYAKGAWVLSMLEKILGRESFDHGIRAFVSAPAGRTDYAAFVAGFGPDANKAAHFLKPWIDEAGAPRIEVTGDEDGFALVQTGHVYWLPEFDLALEHADGKVEWIRVNIEGKITKVRTRAKPARVHLDPFERYLLIGSRVVAASGYKLKQP